MENNKTIYLGAGCFWCVEAVYQRLLGVEKVVSGYMGGQSDNPTYKEVCSGTTGHAEVVEVTYNPDQITLEELIEIFWTVHDPTTLNRQGADVGTQYRSAIFYADDVEKAIAEKSMSTSGKAMWSDPIVTEITEKSTFYPAEEYHQDYFNLKGASNGYCTAVVAPKVAKFKKKYAHKLKPTND